MKPYLIGIFVLLLISFPQSSLAASQKPSISLTLPARGGVYDRTEKMPIVWETKGITRDMVAVTKITLERQDTSAPSVGYVSGSVSQHVVHAEDSLGGFTHDWGLNESIPGRYSITTELRACNPKGCDQAPVGKLLSKKGKPLSVRITNNAGWSPTGVSTESSIELLSPTGGEQYTIGTNKKLKISWQVSGVSPKSRICVLLERKGGNGGYFTFPADSSCKTAKEGKGSITGPLVRTSGYNLASGEYWVHLNLEGPISFEGKDTPTLAQDISEDTITLR